MHGCADCASRLNCTSCTGSLRLQSGACRTVCADGYVFCVCVFIRCVFPLEYVDFVFFSLENVVFFFRDFMVE